MSSNTNTTRVTEQRSIDADLEEESIHKIGCDNFSKQLYVGTDSYRTLSTLGMSDNTFGEISMSNEAEGHFEEETARMEEQQNRSLMQRGFPLVT